jgi:hypothetical protein
MSVPEVIDEIRRLLVIELMVDADLADLADLRR